MRGVGCGQPGERCSENTVHKRNQQGGRHLCVRAMVSGDMRACAWRPTAQLDGCMYCLLYCRMEVGLDELHKGIAHCALVLPPCADLYCHILCAACRMKVGLDELYKGNVRKLQMTRSVKCDKCTGSGSRSGRKYSCEVRRGEMKGWPCAEA